jgi:hypothetical protein
MPAAGWAGPHTATLLAALALLGALRRQAQPMADWSLARDIPHHAQDEAACLLVFRAEHAVRIGLPAPGGTARFHTLGGLLAALCLRMGIPARGPGGYEVFPV